MKKFLFLVLMVSTTVFAQATMEELMEHSANGEPISNAQIAEIKKRFSRGDIIVLKMKVVESAATSLKHNLEPMEYRFEGKEDVKQIEKFLKDEQLRGGKIVHAIRYTSDSKLLKMRSKFLKRAPVIGLAGTISTFAGIKMVEKSKSAARLNNSDRSIENNKHASPSSKVSKTSSAKGL